MMKRTIKFLGITFPVLLFFAACEKDLETIPTDRFAYDVIVNSQQGLQALLYSAYNFNNAGWEGKDYIMQTEVNTDIGYNTGGGENRDLIQFINFNVDASSGRLHHWWNQSYFAIRDANILIESLEVGEFDEDFESRLAAEARYIRAFEYDELYKLFGPVPLRTSTTQPADLPRASEEEMETFIENELQAVVSDLPHPGEEGLYGRATKGSALGILTKFYLNTKQWEKVLTASQDLMDLNYYQLYPEFREMFFIENEGNREMIVVWPRINIPGNSNSFPNGAYPPGFKRAANIPEFEWTPNMANWATQYRLRDAFVDSFDEEDDRLQAIVQVYENRNGQIINLRDNVDDSRSFKYFDQAQTGNEAGNDFVVLRYADILLSRAEALNELYGPTEEAIQLVNMVRERAGVDPYLLGDVGGKDQFRDLILAERGWEFVSEMKRREDLIRHGKYISLAQERGVNARPHHVYFPIPEAELNANKAIEQNEGY